MITNLDQDIKKQRQNLLRSGLINKSVEKNQITKYSKHIWFKGSRFR